MKVAVLTAMALFVSPAVVGQAKSAKARVAEADRDQLGMACAQIVEMSASDWVAAFKEKSQDAEPEQPKTVRAIGVYGKCYDARTDRLAAVLGRKGAGPLTGARGSFRDFEQALESFTAKALAVNDPPADAVKAAYTALYEKQFRYMFYEGYEKPAAKSAGGKASPSANFPRAASGKTASASTPAPVQNAAAPAADDADPVTMVKNHFGELLDALPEDKMHQLHAAFGDIVSRGEMSEAMRLAVYRYAIFLLEPSTDQPFSPPPF